jgi:hypothetical protein
MEVIGRLHVQDDLPQGKEWGLDGRLGGPQNRSGPCAVYSGHLYSVHRAGILDVQTSYRQTLVSLRKLKVINSVIT